MDFQLRPGETILRTSENQGRFVMPKNWTEFKGKFEREWHGHPRERFEPFRSLGNGRWIYEPNLSDKYKDFAAGAWANDGLRQDAAGLAGAGSATFRIQCPYPFAGIPDWKDPNIPASNGVWVDVAGQGGVAVAVTDPEGTWQTVYVGDKAFDEKIDITNILKARYECFIRLTLAQGAKLRRFRFEGFFMVAPITLPRLAEGDNPMELRCCDKHGQHTVPWNHIVDFRNAADLKAQWAGVSNGAARPSSFAEGWQSIATIDESKPVVATFKFDAPRGRRFGWAYFLTTHKEAPVGQSPPRRAMTEWSVDGRDWMPLADRQITSTPAQWDCSLEGEILTPNGAPAIYLRITSDTAIGNVEFYGHLQVEGDTDAPLEITHSWKESGQVREFKVPAGATNYTISCGKEPRDHAIRMSVESVGK
jgi:hypothetical protein